MEWAQRRMAHGRPWPRQTSRGPHRRQESAASDALSAPNRRDIFRLPFLLSSLRSGASPPLSPAQAQKGGTDETGKGLCPLLRQRVTPSLSLGPRCADLKNAFARGAPTRFLLRETARVAPSPDASKEQLAATRSPSPYLSHRRAQPPTPAFHSFSLSGGFCQGPNSSHQCCKGLERNTREKGQPKTQQH